MPRSAPRYPDAFRSEAVALVWSGDRSLPQIARELGINDQTLRNWVRQAEIDAGRGAPGKLTTDERAELVRLRREEPGAPAGARDPEKSRGLLRERDAVSRYRFIAAEQAHYPIAVLCRTLGVARSGYYAWLDRDVSTRQQANLRLTERIRVVHADSRQTYGSPRVHAALRQQGVCCSRKWIARLMRAAGLVGCRLRRRTGTTRADPAHPPAPNLVARQFTVEQLDQLWVGDIPTWEGWLYLAVLFDACSRRVVGWAMAEHLGGELTRDALAVALARRQPVTDLVHHSDRGSQYTASACRALLAQYGVTASMCRAGDCYNNVLAESFIATLKIELIDRQPWPTWRAARRTLFDWIEGFYNRRRLLSAWATRALSPSRRI